MLRKDGAGLMMFWVVGKSVGEIGDEGLGIVDVLGGEWGGLVGNVGIGFGCGVNWMLVVSSARWTKYL